MNTVLSIDRTFPFDPVAFLGNGSAIEEEDERSLALLEVDMAKVQLKTMLHEWEKTVTGGEKVRRLIEAGHIRLDAKVFETFWENQHLIPEEWRQTTNCNTTFVFFDGTILRDSGGDRYVLSLYWGSGEWRSHCYWLDFEWCASDPSAILLA